MTRTGVAYVTDRGAGAVFRVDAGATERIAALRAPRFAGVALTRDESNVLVSALSERGTDDVVVIDARTRRTGTFDKTIGKNREGSGLHRA